MRPRVEELVKYDHDCTEDESAEIKRLLDDATEVERQSIAGRWPLEFNEWYKETSMGHRKQGANVIHRNVRAVYNPIVSVNLDGTIDVDFQDSFEALLDSNGYPMAWPYPRDLAPLCDGTILDKALGFTDGKDKRPAWKQLKSLSKVLKAQAKKEKE